MSGTDWRALCEELLRALTTTNPSAFGQFVELEDRARAALAQPEPEVVADGPAVPEGREPAAVVGEPSDEELLDLAAAEMENSPNWEEPEYSYEAGRPFPYEAPGCAWVNFARAVLARFGGRPAPAPAEEVGELVAWLRMQGEAQKPGPNSLLSDRTKNERHAAGMKLTRAADLLERQAAPVPVAVTERLHQPKDCDAEGRCWWWDGEWGLIDQRFTDYLVTHWLPAHALPLPSGEVE